MTDDLIAQIEALPFYENAEAGVTVPIGTSRRLRDYRARVLAILRAEPSRSSPDPQRNKSRKPTAKEQPWCQYPSYDEVDKIWLCCHGGTNCGGCHTWPQNCTEDHTPWGPEGYCKCGFYPYSKEHANQ